MNSGKYKLGHKQKQKIIIQGKVKLDILANSCPNVKKSEIEYYIMLPMTGVHNYSGKTLNWAQHRENTRVCTLTIIDPDDYNIIKSIPEHTGKSKSHKSLL